MDDLIVSGLRIDWNMLTDSYVSRIPSLRSIDELEFHKNVTFLVGENGSGKSTLLEGIAVACGFNAEGGTRNYRFSTYDDTSDLAKAMTIYRQYAIGPSSFFLRAESFFHAGDTGS
ncbi:AAA family ATPase [Bifidobacterium adolescentis]|uniref:AAA family ATPase n=1 Tax=Bifidobacterium adolescentis TaxID=1680 RepID=UPI001EE8AE5D|nr:AAA family ATPase [Bifidobacterium adolescentis]